MLIIPSLNPLHYADNYLTSITEGQYFSEEQMRFREPLLYEQYIGQYLSEDEILQRSQEAMESGTTGGLADLLINSYQERVLQGRLQEQQDKEDGAQEEEDEEEDDDDDGEQGCRT